MMARGPTWTDWEDEVLDAARKARMRYNDIVTVMPWRSPLACRVRMKILRELAGFPPRSEYDRYSGFDSEGGGVWEQRDWATAARKSNDMFLAALNGRMAV